MKIEFEISEEKLGNIDLFAETVQMSFQEIFESGVNAVFQNYGLKPIFLEKENASGPQNGT